MKKRIIISLISLLLGGCTVNINTPAPNETNNSEKEAIIESTSDKKEESAPVEIEEPSKTEVVVTTQSKEEFIIAKFKEYGKDVKASDWILKEEGPKTAVIIKELRTNTRPLISKLIFKWNGSSDKAEIYFIMVDNNNHYGQE
ncbi:hypothetical protein G7059_08215 [Erysipelothrix sp. HDW6A]|uniref:hypothetical protein n=1 Tax=Erysipelothrix sp. HDW6A TaxID=2714928 RepID=UPI00140E8F55|nr:hypothetical protein [Erysipelothrix sp. HDW6A]QIK57822.1 hypothetical protein G7059_08215 [Erysipelothrix sp. HDW6A]